MKRIARFLACTSMAICLSAHAQSPKDIEQAKATTAANWLALADSSRHASTWQLEGFGLLHPLAKRAVRLTSF